MDTIKLYEAMGTKYIINVLDGRLEGVLNKCVAEGKVLDLADCKFGPRSVGVLNRYYGKIHMVNSTDKKLDELLSYNYQTVTEELEEYEILDITNTKDPSVFIELTKTLPTGKYKPVLNHSNLRDRATMVLLILARPDCEFDIREYASDIFDFVRDVWVTNAGHHEKYYELHAPDVAVVTVDDNNYYADEFYTPHKEESYINNKQVLPFEFGNSQIVKLDGSGVPDEWKPVVEKCLKIFETPVKPKRKKGKVIKNYLTFREEI